jgi:hypothetical protein
MSDEATADPLQEAKHTLADRLKALRLEIFGEHGGPEMARRLGLPVRTWYDCESGESIPGEILVLLVERTEVCPSWLLTGRGAKLRSASG